MSGSGPPIRLFTYAPSRSAETARQLYDGARGALLTDGYEVYANVAQTYGLLHLGCWAHARRRFVEAEAVLPKATRTPDQPATQFIAAIGELYALEAKARDLPIEVRTRLRGQHSRPVLAKIETLLLAHLHGVLPGSLLGKALHYLSGQWPKLVRFVDDDGTILELQTAKTGLQRSAIARAPSQTDSSP